MLRTAPRPDRRLEPETAEGGAAAPSLDRSLVTGIAWGAGGRWTGQLIAWATTLVVARLLTPADYGIVAMAMLVVGCLDLLTDFGLGSALIHEPEIDSTDAQAIMGAVAMAGAVGVLVMLAAAAPVAMLFDEPRLEAVIWALGLTLAATALAVVPQALLQRRLRFDLLAKTQLVQGLSISAVSLALAAVLQTYWALILGLIAGKVIFAGAMLWLAPVRPRLPTASPRIGRLLRFGGVVTGERLVWYFRNNVDFGIIGLLLGGQLLGLYSMAVALARIPLDKAVAVVTPVIFPVLARARSNPALLQRHYLGLAAGVAMVAAPAGLGVALTAPMLVPALLGPNWAGAVLPLQILALITPLQALSSLNPPTLKAVGDVRTSFNLTLAMAVIAPVAILVGVRWGIAGVAAAGAVAYAPVACFGFWMTWRRIGISFHVYARQLWPALSSAAAMAATIMAVDRWAWPQPDLARLGYLIAAGVLSYALALATLHRSTVRSQARTVRAALARS